MPNIRAISTFMVMVAIFLFMFFLAIAIMDPFTQTMLQFDAGGMSSQIEGIHVAIVKYMLPVGIFTFLGWAVFRIFAEERQTRLR